MSAPVAIINYHYCHPPGASFEGLKGITPDDLDAHLRTLASAGLEIRRLSEVVDAPPTEPCAVLTFDDGLKDLRQYVLPVLQEHGVSATFFASSRPYTDRELLQVHRVHLLEAVLGFPEFERRVRSALPKADGTKWDDERFSHLYPHDGDLVRAIKIDLNYRLPYDTVEPVIRTLVGEVLGDESMLVAELYLDENEIQECLDAGLELGLHSHSHRMMSRLSISEQRDEVRACREFFADRFGTKAFLFSYPYGVDGTYDERTLRVLREAPGVMAGLTLGRRPAQRHDIESRWQIPRLDNRDVFGFDRCLRLDAVGAIRH